MLREIDIWNAERRITAKVFKHARGISGSQMVLYWSIYT